MISSPEKLKLPTTSGEPVEVLTAWTKKAGHKFLKIRIGDKEAIIPREAFVRAALILGDDEEQEKLIPTRHATIRHFVKRLKLRMTKTVREGEFLELNVPFDVPLSDQAAQTLTFK